MTIRNPGTLDDVALVVASLINTISSVRIHRVRDSAQWQIVDNKLGADFGLPLCGLLFIANYCFCHDNNYRDLSADKLRPNSKAIDLTDPMAVEFILQWLYEIGVISCLEYRRLLRAIRIYD